MKKRMKQTILASISLIILLSTACQPVQQKPDDALVASSTAVMRTVEALNTQLARMSTPTKTSTAVVSIPLTAGTEIPTPEDLLTLIATPTQIPTPALPLNTCDAAEYISETIVDKAQLVPGTSFVKTWTLRNSGTCTWTKDYRLVFESGEAMTKLVSIPFTTKEIKPGGTVTLSVNMVAPDTDGEHVGFWRLSNAAGLRFGLGGEGKAFYIQIIVGPEVKDVLKVTSANVSVVPTYFKGFCGKNGYTVYFIGKIKANKAGMVTYHWEDNAGRVDTTIHQIIFYGADEAIVNSATVYKKGYHEDWVRIYIDSPNKQAFDKVEYNIVCND